MRYTEVLRAGVGESSGRRKEARSGRAYLVRGGFRYCGAFVGGVVFDEDVGFQVDLLGHRFGLALFVCAVK